MTIGAFGSISAVRPSASGARGLRRFVVVSVCVHLAAGLLVVARWPPAPPPAEVPATIQVLFGENADVAGAPSPPMPPPLPPVASGIAPSSSGVGDGATAPVPGAAPSRPSLPVRLGEGDLGLKLTDPPDPGMIEAQADPGNRAPKFPDGAWQRHQYGSVLIRLHVDTEGRVAEADILESSGHPALDRAAREALAKWHFIPALRDGVAVPSFRDQVVKFVPE